MLISSKDNAQIKEVSSLKEKKNRERTGKYLIEGYRCMKDSLPFLSNPTVFLAESAFARFGEEFSAYNIVVCTDSVFAKIADTDNSQGVVCVADVIVKEPNYSSKYALFLDRVRDPGNLGTIIRTALAVGFNDIYCFDCVDAFNPKVVRSAMSALSRVNIYSVDMTAISQLKLNGYKLVCADMNGKNVFTAEIDAQKICLAIGNEANGLSYEVKTLSDEILSLPMNDVESLNAAVSASVMMYQIACGVKK